MANNEAVAEQENGSALLNDVTRFISRFVVLTPAQSDVCALWLMHTHALAAAECTPYMHIFSPMPRSGKTRLLTLLSLLAAKAWMTGRVSAAVLVRKTDKEEPTLLLDESDAAFKGDREYTEALRGILNTGFQRTGGRASVCVRQGKDWDYKDFKTFSPKAIAGIGRLPQTIEDRAIPIELERKRRSEERERFRILPVLQETKQLMTRLARWAAQNVATLRTATPTLPDELNDRQQDVCEPLLAIADQVGGEWRGRARRALIELLAGRPAEDNSTALCLLADIRAAFQRSGVERLSSRDLLAALTSDETSPWREYRGKPLSAPQLAANLKPFGVLPRDIRFGSQILKGYERSDFEDTWDRYLSYTSITPSEAQQAQQANSHAPSENGMRGQQEGRVAARESGGDALFTPIVADVAPQTDPIADLSDVDTEVCVCSMDPCQEGLHDTSERESNVS